MGHHQSWSVCLNTTKMKAFAIVLLAVVAANAEAEAEADAYTFGQIAYGLPQHNAYATGHPHNVGVITGVDYGHGLVSGYGGHYYGKRAADSDADAYTFGQIAYGLPQHNAYATGHPHNVGVITGVDYGYGRVSGYGAIGNRAIYGGFHHGAYAGYTGAYYG